MFISVLSSIIYVILNSLSIWLIGTMLGNIMSGESFVIQNPSNLNEKLNFIVQNFIGYFRQQVLYQLSVYYLCHLLN